MKYSMILLIPIVFNLFNCTNYMKYKSAAKYFSCPTSDCLNDGLVDMSNVDSSLYNQFYNEFMSSVDTLSRSTKVIESIFLGIKDEMSKILLSSCKIDTVKRFYFLGVDPKGTIELKTFKKDSVIDKDEIANFNSTFLAMKYNLPPSPNLYTRRNIIVIGDSISIDTCNFYSPISIDLGGRSRASIMSIVMKYIDKMRFGYNRRLVQKPGIKGEITTKFAIDHYGNVIFCEVINSTANDEILEAMIVQQIKGWKFEYIKKPGDVTEVIYPFIFSQ